MWMDAEYEKQQRQQVRQQFSQQYSNHYQEPKMMQKKMQDAKMQMYEAQAIAIEKDQKLEIMMNALIEKNATIQSLQEKLTRLEREKAAQKNHDDLTARVSVLEKAVSGIKINLIDLEGGFSMAIKNEEEKCHKKVENLEKKVANMEAVNLQLMKQFSVLQELVTNSLSNQISRETKPLTVQEKRNENVSILLLGGMPDSRSLAIYSSSGKRWEPIAANLEKSLHAFGVAVVKEDIFVFGGYLQKRCSAECFRLRYNGTWQSMASLNQKRAEIASSSVVFDDEIWVIGGETEGRNPLSSVEKYNNTLNKWIKMSDLSLPRTRAAAAILNGRIYVSCGSCGNISSNSVEVFDPALQKWSLFCKLPDTVTGHCMISLSDQRSLAVLGGWNDFSYSNSCWKLDVTDPNKQWIAMPSLSQRRANFGAVVIKNQIIVFGGENPDDIKSTEMFDGEKWSNGPALITAQSFFGYTGIPKAVEEFLLHQNQRKEILGRTALFNNPRRYTFRLDLD